MATKQNEVKVTGDIASRVTSLEDRIAALEKQAWKTKRATRKKHEYTEEERANIRARLLAGQEAARKRQDNEVKTTKKVKSVNIERVKTVVAEKPVKA